MKHFHQRHGFGLLALFFLTCLISLAGLMQQTQVLVAVLHDQGTLWHRLQADDRDGRNGIELISTQAEEGNTISR